MMMTGFPKNKCRTIRVPVLIGLLSIVCFQPLHGEDTEAVGLDEAPITESDREHWSFRPLTRPAVPSVDDHGWCRTPIDRFVFQKFASKQLAPLAEANRLTLLRRLHFDVVGLPPDPEAVEEFVGDHLPGAYERLVERLLSSPHFGEQSAQLWLDLARFAESDGFEFDKVRKDAWRYRDWVIGALNDDMPYSRFVQLQVAGDELLPGDRDAHTATAFCLSGPDMPDVNSQEERRHNVLNELTSTVGSVFLGLQFGCAQCHDHKYDPLSIADFYRLRAIFEPAVQVKKNESVGLLRTKADLATHSYVMLRGDWQRKGPEIQPSFPRIVNFWNDEIQGASADGKAQQRRAEFGRWLTRSDHPLTARVMANRVWQQHFGNGLSRTPSDFGIVGDEPTHPELLDWLATELVDSGWSLKHLHRLIVNSAVYRQASRPADAGWSSQESDAAKASWAHSHQVDPANLYLARFPRRRLTGEAIRDAMLMSAGTLNAERGGPGVRPPLPAEIVKVLLKDQWPVSREVSDHYRRSIYLFARRNLRYPIFEVFDRPDANASCSQRTESTTAPQSLLLLNSELSLDLARRFAGRVLHESPGTLEQKIDMSVRHALGRPAEAEELAGLMRFYERQVELIRSENRPPEKLAAPTPVPSEMPPADAAAFVDLCLVLFNASEFLYID